MSPPNKAGAGDLASRDRGSTCTLDSNGWRYAGFFLTAVALLAAVYLALQGRWGDATLLGGFVVAAALFARWRERLPSLFTFLFTLAAAINAAGYAFDLFQSPIWFDEFVHIVTPFAIVAALAWLLIKRNDVDPVSNTGTYFAKIVLLGILIGLLWEGFEWLIGIIGTRQDTLTDLAMDGVGSILAAIFCRSADRTGATERLIAAGQSASRVVLQPSDRI